MRRTRVRTHSHQPFPHFLTITYYLQVELPKTKRHSVPSMEARSSFIRIRLIVMYPFSRQAGRSTAFVPDFSIPSAFTRNYLFDVVQFVQRLDRRQIIDIQIYKFIPYLREDRVVQLEYTQLISFMMLRHLLYRFRQA